MPETSQPDFSAGIWIGRKAPSAAVFDVANGLIDDEGNLARRGASAYHSNADAGDTLVGIFDGYLAAGQRTLIWAATGATHRAYILGSDDATPAFLQNVTKAIDPFARGTIANGILFLPCAQAGGSPFLWAGSRIAADHDFSVSVSLTNGSTTMTGSGTTWSTDYATGAIVTIGSKLYTAVSVDSNTQITLSAAYDGTTGTYTAVISNHQGADTWLSAVLTPPRLLTATGTSARLWSVIGNNRAYYTDPGGGGSFVYENNYIDLPSNSYITGIDSFGDSLVLFTTEGVWTITNTDLDPIDDQANVQWQQQEVSRDVILWSDPGIAASDGQLIVPAIDDAYLFAVDGSATSVSEGVRPKYREYVAAGYSTGRGAVHRGHYFLPIVNGTTLVDTLVCRLDRPTQTPSGRVIRPWTRWEGHAAEGAYTQRVGADTREPKLLGISGQRVTDLTACLDGQGPTDADGSVIGWTATLNDIPLGFGTATRLRAWYELAATDAVSRLPWVKDPWARGDEPIEADGQLFTGVGRSYLSTQPQVAPLAGPITIIGRPAANADDNVFSVVGFVQNTVAGSGYEARLYYGLTQDWITIERYDSSSRTRILNPVNLGARIAFGDTFELRVSTGGTLSVWINGSSVGSVSSTTYFHSGETAHSVVGISDSTLQTSILMQSDTLPAPTTTTVTVEYSSDQDGDVFTSLDVKGEQGGEAGWTFSDGSAYQWANVNKKRDKIRFRLTLAGAATSFKLRAIDLLSRASGKS